MAGQGIRGVVDGRSVLIGSAAFAAMKPGGIVVNVARGEIIDETAMLDALDAGHLKAAVLDVYAGEYDGPPLEPLELYTNKSGAEIVEYNPYHDGARVTERTIQRLLARAFEHEAT